MLFKRFHRLYPLRGALPVIGPANVFTANSNPVEPGLARSVTFDSAGRSPGLLEDMLLEVAQPSLAQELLDPALLFRRCTHSGTRFPFTALRMLRHHEA